MTSLPHESTYEVTAAGKAFTVLLLAVATLSPGSALAHIVAGVPGGFISGFEHPLTGLDHFLAMFAVGLWGAQMGGSSIWKLPVAFPLIMTLGGVLGMAGVEIPYVETGIALSIVVLGGAIAFAWKPPQAVALLIVSVFAIFHGYAHGKELPDAADKAAYAVGFVIATGLIHVIGIGVGLVLHKPYQGRIAQALGVVIAAGGFYFLLGA